jgi:peptidoglycan DL-endopeptidase CwlO
VPRTVALTHTPLRFRPLAIGALVVTAAVLVLPSGATAAPDAPAPTVATVTKQLDQLAHRSEALAERYNAAKLDVAHHQRAVTVAKRRAAAASATFDDTRKEVAQFEAAQYEGGSFSRTGAILSSGSGRSYLDDIAAQDMLASHAASVLDQLNGAKARADAAGRSAQSSLAAARTKQAALKKARTKVVAETDRYQTLLARLTDAQRRAYATRNAVQVGTSYTVHAGSAAAQRAVDFALAQVGKPYVWAAAGPDSYDCSGLTMAAWAAGGVTLPHLASEQYNYGTHVSASALQPGDLIFLYPDLSHVEIYVGNGLAVSAPQPGEDVQVVHVSDYLSDFSGATRLA